MPAATTRIFTSPVGEFDAAIDQQSGLLVIVLAKESEGLYVLSRSADGKWTRLSLLVAKLSGLDGLSIEGTKNGVLRAGSEDTKE